ncbi:hypothetical protein C2S52_021186 [Perilla frutescens var. hirtella]|nr:hypothetical protein C2S52_021186 [Perilla frutescens var. hirtella]KAH6808152.1 hypothetical protein C2S51_029260 [Perilla frutescens var. frutescens]
MAVSLEALAMSGGDFKEVGFDFEEWEQMESEVPPYLLADDDEEEENQEVEKMEWKNVDSKWEFEEDDCEGQSGKDRSGIFVMIIIWTIIVMRKCRKTRSSFMSTILCNVFAHVAAVIIHMHH